MRELAAEGRVRGDHLHLRTLMLPQALKIGNNHFKC